MHSNKKILMLFIGYIPYIRIPAGPASQAPPALLRRVACCANWRGVFSMYSTGMYVTLPRGPGYHGCAESYNQV